MASIDKIYGTQAQWDELHAWVERNRPDALRAFYPRPETGGPDHALTNFSQETDMWLLENCPLKWVTDRIRQQYNLAQEPMK